MQTDPKFIVYPPLTPIVAPWMENVFGNSAFLESLFMDYGSPINLLHTEPFEEITIGWHGSLRSINCLLPSFLHAKPTGAEYL